MGIALRYDIRIYETGKNKMRIRFDRTMLRDADLVYF
jgi:hypothetical protein